MKYKTVLGTMIPGLSKAVDVLNREKHDIAINLITEECKNKIDEAVNWGESEISTLILSGYTREEIESTLIFGITCFDSLELFVDIIFEVKSPHGRNQKTFGSEKIKSTSYNYTKKRNIEGLDVVVTLLANCDMSLIEL